jgi:hypothetical protein
VPPDRVRSELLQCSPQGLQPPNDSDDPVELLPAVAAFNRLLDRLRDASETQQRFLANAALSAHSLRRIANAFGLLLRRDLATYPRAEVETMSNATTRAPAMRILDTT